ncbi:MAG TPA: GNAT family N-acetyltransferase [Gammaproteobacteria bacterium]|nr:GNAT family N-acetyltransferase [Gammaproteobacteria bacterium]
MPPMKNLAYRKAHEDDLNEIITLLMDDKFGKQRQQAFSKFYDKYVETFHTINDDPDQYLMVVENEKEIIATCHLTILPSLTYNCSTRLQIEAVRVKEKYRGKSVGQWMINQAIDYGKQRGVAIIQLMTDKRRDNAEKFYQQLNFNSSHHGMKLRVSL